MVAVITNNCAGINRPRQTYFVTLTLGTLEVEADDSASAQFVMNFRTHIYESLYFCLTTWLLHQAKVTHLYCSIDQTFKVMSVSVKVLCGCYKLLPEVYRIAENFTGSLKVLIHIPLLGF